MTRTLRVEMRAIHKVYADGTIALRGVDFRIGQQEIVGLLGENGAGKSTLMKILSGFVRPTRGEILVDGVPRRFGSPADALRVGIGMVHQTFTLVPVYSALENILLGQEATGPLRPPQWRGMRRRIEQLMEETGLTVPLDAPVETLPVGVQQRVEILKVLSRGTSILILDEPTSALTPREVTDLFAFLRGLKARGSAIVFITHKLREVLEIADRVVVLRAGQVTGERSSADATPEMLAEMMVGRAVVPRISRLFRTPGRPVLEVRSLGVLSDRGTLAVRDLSFEVREGEVFGIAGVEGNGQSELVQALTGLRPAASGEVLLHGAPVLFLSPLELYRRGMSHIPEDRTRFGLALEFDVAENSLLGRQAEPAFVGPLGRLRWDRVLRYAAELVDRFQIHTPGLRVPVRSLSGGNQQRLVVGRELSKRPTLVVAVHPTRGLDVASTAYIRELLVRMRDEGGAVLLVSADLDEVLELSDRIAVMYEGRFVGVGTTERWSREAIGMMMGGIVPHGVQDAAVRPVHR